MGHEGIFGDEEDGRGAKGQRPGHQHRHVGEEEVRDEAPTVHEEEEGPRQFWVEGGVGLREHIARDAGDDHSFLPAEALALGEAEGDPFGDRVMQRGPRAL